MRQLNANEIARTAFYGGTKTCPYCKNQNTDVVMDSVYLAPFRKFYGGKKFNVINCWCCEAVFSFMIPEDPQDKEHAKPARDVK